jgi:hypothetical protein
MLAPDPELIADALLSAHPDAEPYEVPGQQLELWLADVGVADPDDALVAATLAAWELRRA